MPCQQITFIHKLYNLLQHQQDGICWNDKGDGFYVVNIGVLRTYLPTYFRHDKYSSFVRQLNLYGFALYKRFQIIEYRHAILRRSNRATCEMCPRKATNAEMATIRAKARQGFNMDGSDGIPCVDAYERIRPQKKRVGNNILENPPKKRVKKCVVEEEDINSSSSSSPPLVESTTSESSSSVEEGTNPVSAYIIQQVEQMTMKIVQKVEDDKENIAPAFLPTSPCSLLDFALFDFTSEQSAVFI